LAAILDQINNTTFHHDLSIIWVPEHEEIPGMRKLMKSPRQQPSQTCKDGHLRSHVELKKSRWKQIRNMEKAVGLH